jgi:hypothetical protein
MVGFEEAEMLRRLSHEKETSSNVNVSGVHARKIQETQLVVWPSPRSMTLMLQFSTELQIAHHLFLSTTDMGEQA